MLQSSVWDSTDSLVRGQFRMLSEIADSARLDADELRRALSLSEPEWAKWSAFLQSGPLPAQPRLPDMLFRLGTASYTLAVSAELQAVA